MSAPDRGPRRLGPDLSAVVDDAELRTKLEDTHRRYPGPPPAPIARGTVDPVAEEGRRRFDRLERWGVPYRERLLVMDEDLAGERFRRTEAIACVDEFIAAADRGLHNLLVLAGENKGTGKTIGAVYLLEHAEPRLRYGRTWSADQHPRFVHATDLVRHGLYDDPDRRGRGISSLEDLANCKALAIDEIGGEYLDGKGLFLSELEWLLNRRYESGGYTVITSNLAMPVFRSRYGERIEDRFRHRAAWFELAGPSLRQAPSDG